MGKLLASAGCLIGLVLLPGAYGQEWTRFRGPNGSGVSTATTVPVRWTEKDYNWNITLPGGGSLPGQPLTFTYEADRVEWRGKFRSAAHHGALTRVCFSGRIGEPSAPCSARLGSFCAAVAHLTRHRVSPRFVRKNSPG